MDALNHEEGNCDEENRHRRAPLGRPAGAIGLRRGEKAAGKTGGRRL